MENSAAEFEKYSDPADSYDSLYLIGFTLTFLSQIIFDLAHPYILLE